MTRGLSASEAAERLARDGPNEPATTARAPLAGLFGLFANPLVAILLFAALISAFLREVGPAAIIVAIVVVSAALNAAQAFRSHRAVERLRAGIAPTATALRDGAFVVIPRREVVVGDVVRLAAGDLVPADARLIDAEHLHVQEAALTGESLPVAKDAAGGTLVFLGTSIVAGDATAEVVATGERTAFGDIAARLSTRPPETEFERGLRAFSALILRVVVFLVLFILVVSITTGRGAFESLLFAVALAVGLTPEFLPVISSVTLAKGAVAMAREHVVVKRLSAIENLGSIDVLCSDKTGTITRGEMTLASAVDARGAPSDDVLEHARLNSTFETGIASPLDAAVLAAAGKAEGWTKLHEVPFDFERRRVSIVTERAGERRLVTKGAPEAVLAVASTLPDGAPLDDAARARARETVRAMGAEGLRVLAVAHRAVEVKDEYDVEDERALVLDGFLSFADPPLEGAREAIAALRRDGVRVKVLTGDDELVTRHVCRAVGIDDARVVTGADVDRMTDSALGHVAQHVAVFARLSPSQKTRVILALRRRGHVVGYLGNGINDAPSLHAADVGISVSGAVDVARDAADMILLRPGLGVLHRGILEGRAAFGNVLKYLLMGTSSNFGNMFSMAAAALFLPFLPMLPPQILLNNLLYDLSQVTIPTDNVDPELVRRPQRWNVRLIRNFMLLVGPVSSAYDLLTFWVLLHFFRAGEELFHTGWFVESLATQTLVLLVIRTRKSPLRSRPSVALLATVLAIVALAAILPFTPVAAPLGFTPLPASYLAFVALATVTYLVLVEIVKRAVMKRFA